MNGFGECVPCASAGMPMNGVRGLAAIVMEPLRGGLANGETGVLDEMRAGAGVLGPGALMAGSAIYGGAVGGLAASSWKGAGTGALLTSGLTGFGAGVALLFAPEAVTAPVVAPTAGLGAISPKTVGGLYALAGAALLAWGGYRAYKGMRRR